MDFDSPDLRDFRLAARDWLANNHAAFTAEHGSSGTDFAHEVTRAKAWQKRKYQAGYAGIFVPEIYGGGGKTFAEEIIFRQEQAKYAIPLDIFFLGRCLDDQVGIRHFFVTTDGFDAAECDFGFLCADLFFFYQTVKSLSNIGFRFFGQV